MAGTAYVLYISDSIAGPALELLRRVIQPGSRSMPHVTVLYVRGDVQDHGTRIYDDFIAERLTLTNPGSFDMRSARAEQLSTLFLRCESPALEFLHHKPDFPDSFLHISMYDGTPSRNAAEAFDVLNKFSWDLEITLPEGRLTPMSAKGSRMPPGELTDAASRLLTDLTRGQFTAADLNTLESAAFRGLVADLSTHLHDSLPSVPPRTQTAGIERALRGGRGISRQEEFWPAVQFIDPERAGHSRSPDRDAHRRGGVFLTPPELAFDITRAALKHVDRREPITFGDPSIGSGIFLASLVNLAGQDAIASAIGVEADPLRGHLTHDRWRSVGLDVVTGDFVDGMCRPLVVRDEDGSDDRWRLDKRNLVLANPPYIRSQQLDFEKTSAWRKVLARLRRTNVGERSDLYVYFVLAAHDWLATSGVAAWLLPTEFMFTNYGAALRDYLTRDVTLLEVHSYDGPSKFSNARVTSCAVIFRNGKPPDDHVVQFSAGGIISDAYVTRGVRVGELAHAAKWHFIADEGITTTAPKQGLTLADLFAVKRGLATGSNRHFLLDTETAESMEAPSSWLLPVVPRSRYLPDAVIEAGASGDPLVDNVKWLIDVDVSLADIEVRAPHLAAYLRSIEEEVSSRTIVRRRRTFYKQEQSKPAKFIFSYMARDQAFGRRFFLNRSRAVILNNYLGLYPKEPVKRWLERSRENDVALLAALRSVEPSDLARAGRVYVEGLTKVEPRELARIRLPGVPPSLAEALQSEDPSAV